MSCSQTLKNLCGWGDESGASDGGLGRQEHGGPFQYFEGPHPCVWTQCPGPSSATPNSPAGTMPTAHIQRGTQGSERARSGLEPSGQGVLRFWVPVPADGHISWGLLTPRGGVWPGRWDSVS